MHPYLHKKILRRATLKIFQREATQEGGIMWKGEINNWLQLHSNPESLSCYPLWTMYFQIYLVGIIGTRPGCKKNPSHVTIACLHEAYCFCLPCPCTGVWSHMQGWGHVWSGIIGFSLAPLKSCVPTTLFCTATHWPIFFLYVTLTPCML